jgi:hypothetical protein
LELSYCAERTVITTIGQPNRKNAALCANDCFDGPNRSMLIGWPVSALGRSRRSTQRADCRPSLQVQSLTSIQEKADLQHKTHVRGAANGGKEPNPTDAALITNDGYRDVSGKDYHHCPLGDACIAERAQTQGKIER